MTVSRPTRGHLRVDLRRILQLVALEKRDYCWGLLALLLVNVTDVAAPLMLAVAIDLIVATLTGTAPETTPILSMIGVGSGDFTLVGALICFVLLHLSSNLFRYPMLMCVAVPSHRISQVIRNQIVDKLLRLSSKYYDTAKSGDIMSLATADLHATRMMLGPAILIGGDTVYIVSLVIVVLFT